MIGCIHPANAPVTCDIPTVLIVTTMWDKSVNHLTLSLELGRPFRSSNFVTSRACECEKSAVSQYLKLLPYLGSHKPILSMKAL